MSMCPSEIVTQYPVHIWYNNHHTEMSVDVLLPNLRYKNKNIVFIFKHPVRIKTNDKTEFKYEQILDDLSLTGSFYCKDTKLNCTIYDDELENGLKVNIKFIDNVTIHKGEIQKFARAIEAKILGIDIMNDNINFEEMSIFNYLENEYDYSDEYSISNESYNESYIEDNYDSYEEYDESFPY